MHKSLKYILLLLIIISLFLVYYNYTRIVDFVIFQNNRRIQGYLYGTMRTFLNKPSLIVTSSNMETISTYWSFNNVLQRYGILPLLAYLALLLHFIAKSLRFKRVLVTGITLAAVIYFQKTGQISLPYFYFIMNYMNAPDLQALPAPRHQTD